MIHHRNSGSSINPKSMTSVDVAGRFSNRNIPRDASHDENKKKLELAAAHGLIHSELRAPNFDCVTVAAAAAIVL